ncbi:Ni/Fe-hydrogenase, b-type cytochrome subunit [Opitutus sp. GAS368]|uniref:Ni/Fe-hydrogenase, b-type cytochrome subunit n=1 Tax=Opitutus sp. GAS368 TaxID=1882749 RepID=UPI00087C4D76|nr:Ni/Fe-hydrogenase, b-type cytochrome subunit [Opitutus sp. GAS368]SDS44479.1 Ni/Fe-hydrogenase 1 B-type cytochrome subunit [Opitutus sp. GAS368]
MNASHDYQRVYVWEQPVRWFHWINAASITALGVTGWLIAHPPGLLNSGEASGSFWFGWVRFVHFAVGYVFLANFVFRIYWAFAGNKYASWRNFLPLRKTQIRQVWNVLKVDILQSSDQPVHTLGHNSVAYFTYAVTGLLTVFQIASGFALYASMSSSPFPQLFAWLVPLFGSEQNLRLFHFAALWAFIVFTVIHVYLVFYHDYVEGHGVLSSIVGGWKFMEKHKIADAEATGLSGLPARQKEPVTPPANPKPIL